MDSMIVIGKPRITHKLDRFTKTNGPWRAVLKWSWRYSRLCPWPPKEIAARGKTPAEALRKARKQFNFRNIQLYRHR